MPAGPTMRRTGNHSPAVGHCSSFLRHPQLLLELKKADDALSVCQHILQHSFPDNQEACFQTANVLKSAILKAFPRARPCK